MKDNPINDDQKASENTDAELSIDDKLRLETATIAWRDLQRFFAAGKVIFVAAGTSLVDVAAQLHNDNLHTFQQWIDSKVVAPVTDDQAADWYKSDATLWAVVVSPWVLVQEPKGLHKPNTGDSKQLH